MRRQKNYFIRKGMAVLLAAVLAVGLFLEADSAFAGRVYAEEVKTGEGLPTDQPTDPETPAPEETKQEEPTVPGTPTVPEAPAQGETEPETPTTPEAPTPEETQPEEPTVPETPTVPEAPAQGETESETMIDSEILSQETVSENTVSEILPEAVMPMSLETGSWEAHNHDGISYTAWESSDSLPDQAGNYYLTENVNLTTKWEAPAGMTSLCLNGKTITQTAAAEALQPVLYIENGTFNLYDCGSGGKITGGQDGGVQAVSGHLNLYGGEISGNCIQINVEGNYIGKSAAGGISLNSESYLYMYGGRITGNSGEFGGGVDVSNESTFVMEDGEISDNRGYYGGGVYVGASDPLEPEEGGHFTMNGGRIANNKTSYVGFSSGPDDGGGGVFHYGLFVMNDGEITGNHSDAVGGGVMDGGSFVMNGGRIADNVAYLDRGDRTSGNGGDVYVLNSHFYMYGGEITGNQAKNAGGVCSSQWEEDEIPLRVGGTAQITGNHDMDGAVRNVWIFTTDWHTDKIVIDVDRPLSDGAMIGVYRGLEDTGTTGDITGANNADYSKYFQSDDEKLEVIDSGTDHVLQLVEVKQHNWATEWSSDETNHWHACLDAGCTGKQNEAAHTEDSGTITKEPTASETGTKTYQCSACGYVMRTEEIPATGGGGDNPGGDEQGDVTADINKGVGAPDINFVGTSKEELEELILPLLTDDERQQMEAGTAVKLILGVQDAGGSVSDSDKNVVTTALDGFAVGQYLDITLKKVVGSAETLLTETAEKVKVTITVPENLRNTDTTKTRTFAVIRVHGGTAERLDDLDDNADTITIETNLFSTYAIVYKDEASGGGDNPGGGTGSGSGDSGSGGTGSGSGDSGSGSGTGSGSGDSGGGSGTGSGSGSSGGGSGDSGSGSSNSGSSSMGSNSAIVSVRAEAGSSDSNNSSSNGSDNKNTENGRANSASGENEPKTGDSTQVELYATIAMIAGLAYFVLYFADRMRGMTEHEKDVFVAAFIRWAKKGGIFRKICAFAAIFVLLLYYHSIGKKTAMEWREIYGA